MANDSTISIRLTVKDDGSVVLRQFADNADKSLGKVSTAAAGPNDIFAAAASRLKNLEAMRA
jgi:hypothetical protein